MEPKVLYNDGSPVVLNKLELHKAKHAEQQIQNALGYQVPITTLTTIVKKVSRQKYYTIPFADYFPVVVGEGQWSDFLLTYRSFDSANTFEAGIIGTGDQNARLNAVEAGVDTLQTPVYSWAKSCFWSIPALEFALRQGNWDIVAEKEKARKRNWDLGIQKIAFVGGSPTSQFSGALGLINQPGVAVDTTTITKLICTMSAAELATLCATLLTNYRKQVNFTVYPDRFVVPEDDYNGLATQSSPTFPIKSIMEVLLDTFKIITQNPNFKILPLAYANSAARGGSQTNYTYALYSSNDEALRMTLPVDYTPTAANSINNFQFENVAYGQFTGVQVLQPLTMVYYQHA